MESRFNEAIHRIYYFLKLNLMLVLGFLLGGCLLSSLTVGISLHLEAKNNAALLTFKQWWNKVKIEYKQTAIISWLYNLCIILLLWALFVTSQLKGIVFLMSWFVQVALLIGCVLTMLAEAQLRQYYEGASWQITKLSWMQLFMSPKANIGTLLLGFILGLVSMQFPAIVFLTGWAIWISFMTSIYYKEWARLKII